MNRKHQSTAICILTVILFVLSCGPLSTPALIPTDVGSPAPITDITATSSSTLLPNTAAPVATPTELPIETYIAYVQNDALLVTHVIGGQPLDTRQYIKSQIRGGIYNIGWSPSGEFLAFNLWANSFTHVFIVNALEGSIPVDLGIANDWAWSPDGKLLAYEHEYELWVFSPSNGQSRQLTTHLGTGWLWTKPVFTPAGDALVAAGTLSDDMDRHGNTRYRLYRVPLDGSAAGSYPPAGIPSLTEEISGRLPLALRFSPDGQMLAMASSTYIDTCATLTQYLVGKPDASDLHKLPVDSLAALGGPDQKMYFFGDSLVWTPQSDGLWVNGYVRDCDKLTGIVGGPQISHVTLDGQEHEIISGVYGSLSLDRSGTLLGVVKAGTVPHVQILGQDGHLVLDLGEGESAALQP